MSPAAIYFTTSKYFPAELLMAISRRLLGENCRDPATPLYRPGGQARREGTADMSPAITSSETTSPAVPHTAGSNVFVQTLEDDDHTVAHLTHLLPSLVRNAPKPVRLIVVDSIATHFREDGAGRGAGGGRGNPSRVQDLYECARSLKCVAESGFSPHGPVGMSRRSDLRRGAAPPPAIDPGIAVVVVNQVTARMSDIKSSGEPLGDLTGGEGLDARDGDATMPCLGPAWSNMVNTRMRMSKKAAVVMDNGAHVAGGDAKTGGEVGLRTFQERCLGIEFSSCAGRTAEVSFTVGADGLTGRST
ncbi:hypothetical protein M427DRAFT_427374 [Gonapodya prolifera JEL478]|uniref:DNA recombination and repair protein Rad51-like C-terminal domain-containing protein n=1 Tax=Gonapodya prolifera (strain JEL478) TaxID=1344416 RepID=A0A139ASF9_GONPJ|nr:hypothetical protein M427DRAFT_427374 [Gonapodya prolifera JEL478]|eukprot:KXS19678.1 hypothetical protein M427DRAFT_427374 [Gonapodya prolifera JEL478]